MYDCGVWLGRRERCHPALRTAEAYESPLCLRFTHNSTNMPTILHINQESFITFIKVPLIASTIIGAWMLFKVLYFLTRPLVSPLRKHKGPKGTSALFGSMHMLLEGDSISHLNKWEAEYGHVYSIRGVLGVRMRTFSLHLLHILRISLLYSTGDASQPTPKQ
jgi:hypothetical protein